MHTVTKQVAFNDATQLTYAVEQCIIHTSQVYRAGTMSDIKLFREAFKAAGFVQVDRYVPQVFNDKHKDGTTRRLKLWFADRVFDAPQFAQEELERQLSLKFGDRYLFGQFIPSSSWCNAGKALVIYLLTE